MARFFFILLIVFPLSLSAQSKRVLNLLEETEYSKAEELINRGLSKGTDEAGLYYCYSILYSKSDYLSFSLQESAKYAGLSLKEYKSMDEDERQDLLKIGIDSARLTQQKLYTDSLGFLQAVEYNSIEKLNEYVAKFEGSKYENRALQLRDSLAFHEVIAGPYDIADLNAFIEDYPSSRQISTARNLLDSLEFEMVIKTGDQSALIDLLRTGLSAQRREEIEKRLFNLTTYRHKADSYLSFLKLVNGGNQASKAVDYLYHIHKTVHPNKSFQDTYPSVPVCDSLKIISGKEDQYAIVVHSGEQLGFMNADGTLILEEKKGSVPDDYICEPVEEDFIITREGENGIIFNRGGYLIYEGSFQNVFDEGNGLLLLEDHSAHMLIHKTGELLFKSEEIVILDSSIVALYDKTQWKLFSVNGTPLLDGTFDHIEESGAFIIMERDDKIAVSTSEDLFANVGDPSDPDFSYSAFELLEFDKMIVKNEGFEGLLNKDLEYEVPFAYQQIISVKNGYLIESEGLFKAFLTSKDIADDEWFEQIDVNEKWIARRKLNKWSIENLQSQTNTGFEYDSVNLLSDNIVIGLDDSLRVLFSHGMPTTMDKEIPIRTLSLKDSGSVVDFLYYTEIDDIVVFSDSGKIIFKGEIDKISALGQSYLLVEKKSKKGLLDLNGNLLLDFKYEAIGNYNDGTVTMLKDKKFGLFDPHKEVLIPAEYDQRIERLKEDVFIVSQKNRWGLSDRKGKPLIKPQYDALEKWTGKYILAKSNDLWQFVDIETEEIVGDSIKSFEIISRNDRETIMKSYSPDGYGIFSSTQGFIVPHEYTDINNIGTLENPIYLAERFFSAADYYLLIYYDRHGNIIRKQGLEPDAYDQIYCD